MAVLILLLPFALLAPAGGRAALWPIAALAAPGARLGQGGVFVENVGQFAPSVRFQVPGGRCTFWLTEDALWVTLLGPTPAAQAGHGANGTQRSAHYRPNNSLDELPDPPDRAAVHLRISFVGANPHARLEPFGRLDTHVSYLIGAGPQEWHPDVPVWDGVRYVDLYPGIGLELRGEGGNLTPSLVLRSGTSIQPGVVRLHVEGADGLMATEEGLTAITPLGEFLLPWFEIGTTSTGDLARPEVVDNEVLDPFVSSPDRRVGGAVESQSSADRDLRYATFLGGAADDEAYGIARGGDGSTFIVGRTSSSDFPAVNGPGYDPTPNGYWDAFVAKLAPDGMSLAYATFLGGSNHDGAMAVAVDGLGQAYVTGWTASPDFPAPAGGGYDTQHSGGHDAFVVKLNYSGTNLLYSTFLGGSDDDTGSAVQVNTAGQAYVAGWTRSADFCAVFGPGYDTHYHGGDCDGFVIKLSADGKALVYATFLGGRGCDAVFGMALDEDGQAYVTGPTTSDDFPAIYGPGYDTSPNGGDDAFVAKLDTSGLTLLYATFLGGTVSDRAYGIAVDDAGRAYVTGETASGDFLTTVGPGFDTTHNGGQDAFVVALDSAGTSLLYATYLGGSQDDHGSSIAVDSLGQAYTAGWTYSADFPAGGGTLFRGPSDAFAAKLSAGGTALLYAVLIGGTAAEEGLGIGVDSAEQVYMVGRTQSGDFPVTNPAYDRTFHGGWDAFALRLATPLSISGRVTGPDGGLGGVMISADGSYSATTDASGVYTITALTAGDHVLAPALSGYMFVPPTRVVSVPPSALQVDFVGSLVPGYTPTATSTSTRAPSTTPSRTPTHTLTPSLTRTPSSTPDAGQGRVMLPLIRRMPAPTPTPSPTPWCDPYEPNDILTRPWGPLRSGEVYQAKLCNGDSEDNYYFDVSSTDEVEIRLRLPARLAVEPFLWVYSADDLKTLNIPGNGEFSGTGQTLQFHPPRSGRYIIRIYASAWDNVNLYTLQVTYR